MTEQATAQDLIGYGRVSTGDQRMDLQIDALRAHGVPEENIYTDQASGVSRNRPGLAMALKRLRPDDVLVVWKLDRLARSVPELIRLVERLREIGADLRVLTQPVDTTSAVGKFVFYMFSALAEMEREMIVERTKAGIAAARDRGKKPGRRPVLTEGKRRRARELLKAGRPVKEVAARVGVGASTIYKHWDAIMLDDVPAEPDESGTEGP